MKGIFGGNGNAENAENGDFQALEGGEILKESESFKGSENLGNGESFAKSLDSLSLEEEREVFRHLAQELGWRLFSLGEISKEKAFSLSLEQMRYFGAIVVGQKGNALFVALKNPFEKSHQETLKMLFAGLAVEFGLIQNSDFKEAIFWLAREERLRNLLGLIPSEIAKDSKASRGEHSSVLELVKFVLQEAVFRGASDVHLERDFEHLRIRFRIDGVLVEYLSLESWLLSPLSSCIKLLSHLNITEAKIPQDGRFSLKLELKSGSLRDFDFRVSTLPLVEGESIVLRILDKQKTLMPLESLGFLPSDLEKITKLFNLPYGLVFITGPTGSGKSTTMYGILNILKERNLKIITLEDPVEYRLRHISQVAMGHKISFASALRNVLRQDPDVIILGEVRDKETLQIAIEAAFTGHLVFATLHTNDSLDTIVRLLDMGLEPYFITQALSGIIAQRLLRKLCVHCRESRQEGFVSKGCEMCNHTGYSGREVVAEIVCMDKDLEDFISQKITKTEILQKILAKMPDFTLEQKALSKARSGITDLKEVYKVVK